VDGSDRSVGRHYEFDEMFTVTSAKIVQVRACVRACVRASIDRSVVVASRAVG